MLENSIFDLFMQASTLVQAVMVFLILMSVFGWTIGLAKTYQTYKASKLLQEFNQEFWEAENIADLYKNLESSQKTKGIYAIFEAGFDEFVTLKKQGVAEANHLIDAVHRSMRIVFNKEANSLESRLSGLATIGSSAPYIGLFGTVIGVMHAFQGLGEVQNATLSSVAPGIAEALLATGIGLFAAIPAVMFYNRLTNKVENLLNQYENFAQEFLTILQRQVYAPTQGQA